MVTVISVESAVKQTEQVNIATWRHSGNPETSQVITMPLPYRMVMLTLHKS
jgi:hypothetical protein